jgi:hypothetical protein
MVCGVTGSNETVPPLLTLADKPPTESLGGVLTSYKG